MAKKYQKRKQKRESDVIVLPSPEACRHGSYVTQRVDVRGPKVARNTSIVPLEDCFQRGQITWGMYNAGLHFERLAVSYRALIEAPMAGRDSCDFTVRGNANETSVERALRIKETYLDALLALEQAELTVLNDILVEHTATGDRRDKYKRWSRFKDGLSALQKHWRIAENEKVA